MAISNRDRVGKALELLNKGIAPFIEREMKAEHSTRWLSVAQQSFMGAPNAGNQADISQWDTTALLQVMWDNWNIVFKKVLGQAERSLVSEIRQFRNRWAHQQSFTGDDTYRAVDSISRLLTAIGAAEESAEMEKQKNEILRTRFEEDRKKEQLKAASAPLDGAPSSGLKPWREIIEPHPDVASGRYQQAEFAADLGVVHRGEGSSEYSDPREFFSRTYMTAGLKDLLSSAIMRINGSGGDPVIELQTNFGGGKTHSLLALYHAFSGLSVSELPGLEAVINELPEQKPLIKARRVVIVGSAQNVAKPSTKSDGTKVHTLWGELAWQLFGKEGYKLVQENDMQGKSPGSDLLRELFIKSGPTLILIDELVVFARQLYGDKGSLSAGNLDSNLSFIHSLVEAAAAVENTLLVISIPASDSVAISNPEIGGEAGNESLARIQSILFRVAKPWRPATGDESFEIVRRRLFQPIEAKDYPARDAVCKAFIAAYSNQKAEFPTGCGEGEYERRMKSAYPIHPELFDRLFNDWSTLYKFQRTRGVLRLMASVIACLWQRNDAGLLIMPAFVPLDDSYVNAQFIRYLDDPWGPIIDKDIDGPNSLPLQLDKGNNNYGKYAACRRVARTTFIGSAASTHMSNKGLDIARIKLGCYQPGEVAACFGDALRKLADSATYLYVDGSRYWYSLQPSVNRMAEDRAGQFNEFVIQDEIIRRLTTSRQKDKNGDQFVSIHVNAESADIPDECGIKLVVLGPDCPHAAKDGGSPARIKASELLEQRGNSPRFYANTLVFAAPDRPRVEELDWAVRRYLAWKSIYNDALELELTPFQAKQAESKLKEFDDTVDRRIGETYIWVLVPGQMNTTDNTQQSTITWEEYRVNSGVEPLGSCIWRKLRDADIVLGQLAGTVLKGDLDKIPLWRGDHVSIKQLIEDFSKYLYLPKIRDAEVLIKSIENGLANIAWSTETFAYSDFYDEKSDRYQGLQAGGMITVALSNTACVVKPEVALRQLDADREKDQPVATTGVITGISGSQTQLVGAHAVNPLHSGSSAAVAEPEKSTAPKRFYARVHVDASRPAKDFGKITDEVISHLSSLLGSDIELTLEITAKSPNGFESHLVRTILENCKTLKFDASDFEKE